MNAVVDISGYRPTAPVPPARPLPANVEAEQAVLGSILMNNAVLAAIGPRLEKEHFFEPLHGIIFDVLATQIREGKPADPVIAPTWLPMEVGPGQPMAGYLAQLAREAGLPINAPHYAGLIIDLHARRQVIAAAMDAIEVAYDPPASLPVESLIEGAETALMEVRNRLKISQSSHMAAGDAAADLITQVERIRTGDEPGMGAPTGLRDLDFDTGGMRPGDLWVLAGRVAMGKSIVGISLAKNAAKGGVGTLLFPFEIGRKQAVARLLSDIAYNARRPIGFGQLLKGRDLTEEDMWRFKEAQEYLGRLPLVVEQSDGATLAQISAKARQVRDRMAKKGVKLGVIVLDYLNFIKASDRYQGQRHNEIGEISIGLKRLAQTLDVCVVLLAQVNRATEARDDKRPQISDLKDSGSLEQDADVVMMVFREVYYLEKSSEYANGDTETIVRANDVRNEVDLIVGKNRTGPTRSLKLWCDVSCSKINAHAPGGM